MGIKEICEMAFDVVYTGVIWILAISMLNMFRKTNQNRNTKSAVSLAFLFLAIGDTGHVISRVIAYANGSINYSMNLFGGDFAVVGIGRITTSITVTLFYFLMMAAWRHEFKKEMNIKYILIQSFGLIRLILLVFEQNRWGDAVSPFDWSVIRNIPLFVVGISVVLLFLIYSKREGNKTFFKVGVAIAVSFGFYIPVIFFVNAFPNIGFLMIPKTLAYLYAAVVFKKGVFAEKKQLES